MSILRNSASARPVFCYTFKLCSPRRIDIIVIRTILAVSLAITGLGLVASTASAQEIYCWKDDASVWRCGDTVPPDQARFDRDVRNDQGIILGVEQGEITEAERAEIAAQVAAEEERRRADEERRRYDQFLVDSFLSVADIERQRDRIIEQFQGEIVVTELYLGNLTRKLEQLSDSAQRYASYSDREGASSLSENLSLDIERTESSITMFEQRLSDIRANQENTRDRYENDIARFRQIKGN